jgi:hypothetical protein
MSKLTFEIEPALRQWLAEHVRPKPHENILVTVDEKTDRQVLDAVKRLLGESGATVVEMEVPAPPIPEGVEEGSHVGEKFIPMPTTAFWARASADKMIDLGGVPAHNPFVTKIDYAYPARRFLLYHGSRDPSWLLTEAARYPARLLIEIARAVLARLRRASLYRLSHVWGTELTFAGLPGDWGPQLGSMPASGWGKFRLGRAVIGCNPPETANGVVVSRYSKDLGGPLSEPLYLHFEEGWLRDIRGGEAAKRMLTLLGDDPNNRRIQEIMMGLNPKISAYAADGSIAYEPGSAGAGNVHLAVGREVGRYASSQHLTPAFLPHVNLLCDGEPLIENGRLRVLDAPDIRATAAQYGDPDKLLRQVGLDVQVPWR